MWTRTPRIGSSASSRSGTWPCSRRGNPAHKHRCRPSVGGIEARMSRVNARPRTERIGPYTWEISVGAVPGMRVPGRVFASEHLFEAAIDDHSVEQVANVATLPGIVGYSYAM